MNYSFPRLSETAKTQSVRVMDVFVFGPIIIYGGYKLIRKEPALGALLLAIGAGTVVYNGKNFLKVFNRQAEETG